MYLQPTTRTTPSSAPTSASAPTASTPAAPVAATSPAPRGPVPVEYRFDLELDPAARSLAGTGAITVRNDQAEPLTEIVLRLWANTPALARGGASAAVSNVTVGGTAVDATTDRTVVRIPLPAPLASGESASVAFDVTTSVTSGMGRTGQGRDGTLYFGNSLPTLAVRDDEGWNLDPYVVAGESFYNLASDWKVRIVAPTDRQLITTGTVASEQVAGGKRAVELSAPHVRDFIVVAASGYEEVSEKVGDTLVRAWAPKGDAKTAQSMLRTAADSLAFYNARYGVYDQPEYDVIATRGLGGGMEYPGVTLNDTGSFQAKEIVAHETGHQWFYSMAGNNQFDDPWLDESFTSFITSEFLKRPTDDVATALHPGFLKRASLTPSPTPFTPRDPNAAVHVSSPMSVLAGRNYFGTIYGTGAKVLQQLKEEIGEEQFVAGMRNHFAASRSGIQSTATYMQTMSDAAGRDLTAWFEQHSVFGDEPSANDKLDPNISI